MNKNKYWRIIIGILSILYIVFMWIKKDILSIYETMPKEEIFPLITTTIIVSLSKVVLIIIIVLFIKWILKKKC